MHFSLNNISIPLPDSITLQLVLRSVLFDTSEGKTAGSFVFDFELDATPNLRLAYSQAHMPERDGRAPAEIPYKLQEGSLRFAGTCQMQEAGQMKYQLRLLVRNGDFAAEAAKKTLKDLQLGGDRVLTTRPYGIATSSTPIGINMQDEVYPIMHQLALISTHTIVDFTNSFTSLNPTGFTVPETGRYYFDATLAVTITFGTLDFLIFKNGIQIESIPFNSGVGILAYDWILQAGDVITFELYTESTGAPIGYEIDIFIEKDFLITMRFENSLFVDIAQLNQDTSDFVVFPVENPNLFENFPADEFQLDNVNIASVYSTSFPVQNYFKRGHFPYMLSGEQNGLHVFAMNVFTPFAYIKYLLDAIAAEFNYELVNSPFVSGEDYFNAVLYNSFAENTYTFDDARMIGVKTTFNLVDHVPEIAITTFLNALGKFTGRRIDIDTESRTMTFIRLADVISSTESTPFPGIITEAPKVLAHEYNGFKIELKAASDKYISTRVKQANSKHEYKGSVTHINLLPAAGNKVNDMYLVTSLNELYVWKYNTSTYRLTWCFHSANFYLTIQSGEEPFYQLTADMAPVMHRKLLDEVVGAPANRSWLLPVTWQPGNFEGFPDMSAEYGLQILLYKGMQADSTASLYPLATSGQVNYSGTIFDNPNLCLDGLQPNLFTTELQNWLNWFVFQTKPVKFKALLTPAQLAKIQSSTKFRVLGNNYLIKETRVNLIDDHLTEAEFEAYSC